MNCPDGDCPSFQIRKLPLRYVTNSQDDNGFRTNRKYRTMRFAAMTIKHLSNRYDEVARLRSERKSFWVIRE